MKNGQNGCSFKKLQPKLQDFSTVLISIFISKLFRRQYSFCRKNLVLPKKFWH